MFKAKIKYDLLIECIEAIVGVVDEGVLTIVKDGWEVNAVDPANVALVRCKLPSESFDKFEFEPKPPEGAHSEAEKIQIMDITPIKIGVDFRSLLGMLKLWDPDVIELELDEKAGTLFVRSGMFDYSFLIVDPSALRKEPRNPEMNFLVQATIEAERFTKAILTLSHVGDYARICVKGAELYMEANGDGGDKLKVAFRNYYSIKGAKNVRFYSLHSLEYLLPMCKGMTHADDDLTISIGKEYPIQIDFDIANGKGKVSYLLAPRIESDE